MRSFYLCLPVLILIVSACQGSAPPVVPVSATVGQSLEIPTLSPATIPASQTSAPAETDTPTPLPAGLIQVDTLEQEVYPFVENGNCSLAEAIFAANAGKPKDSCAAGVQGESIIELMPGEYRFTQSDQTPPQEAWIASTVSVANALPAVIYALTIRGNGATLVRDTAAEPFRFLEVMFGMLTLENITLQNGDVQDDWGGAIYAFNTSMNLDRVRFVNNHADNGGGFYLTFGGLIVQDSEFIENKADFAGGGAYLDSVKSSFVNTEFTGNTTESQGGAIRAEATTLVIEDSLFVKN